MASKPSKPRAKKATEPKAKKAKAKSPKAAKAKKSAAKSPLIGHNSNGQINKPLLKLLNDHIKCDQDKKAITLTQRHIKADAKDKHGVDKAVFDHQVKLMKMDAARAAMFEQGHQQLKDSIGYQHSMEFLQTEENEEPEEGAETPEEGVSEKPQHNDDDDNGESQEDAA